MRGLVPGIHVVQRAMRPDVDGRTGQPWRGRTRPDPHHDARDTRAQDFLTAEALLAPLSEDGSSVSMLFVCVGFWSDA